MSGEHRSIGAVVAGLVVDFPDVTISKIRFLEAEGLVTPQRTASGYRRYSADDVARLTYVLTAQRDRFWPLKVIRDALDALDRGLTVPAPAESGQSGQPEPWGESGKSAVSTGSGVPVVPPLAADPDVPTVAHLREPDDLRLTGAELCAAAGLDTPTFESLVTYGLLRPRAGEHFDAAALAVGRAAAALARFGIEARHLRPFRTAADREIGLVQQAVRPGDDTGAAQVLHECLALHTALVKAGLGA